MPDSLERLSRAAKPRLLTSCALLPLCRRVVSLHQLRSLFGNATLQQIKRTADLVSSMGGHRQVLLIWAVLFAMNQRRNVDEINVYASDGTKICARRSDLVINRAVAAAAELRAARDGLQHLDFVLQGH